MHNKLPMDDSLPVPATESPAPNDVRIPDEDAALKEILLEIKVLLKWSKYARQGRSLFKYLLEFFVHADRC